MRNKLVTVFCLGLAAAAAAHAQERSGRALATWPAPPYWLPSAAIPSGAPTFGEHSATAAEVASVRALPLVAIPPCRLWETDAGGVPALVQGVGQEIAVAGRCGVPEQVQGVSLRLVVIENRGGGRVTVGLPDEGEAAGRLVFEGGATGSTTGVVGLDASGRTVAVAESGSAHLLVEVNGYYAAETAVRRLNGLTGDVTVQAGENIAITSEGSALTIAAAPGGGPGVSRPGELELPVPASPLAGRRVGGVLPRRLATAQAMVPPPSSMYVGGAFQLPATTAVGAGVITLGGNPFLHNWGNGNTFLGENSGNLTMTGTANTASGLSSLNNNGTGFNNTASGWYSLQSNSSGMRNTAIGTASMQHNTMGAGNTAIGDGSLQNNSTGSTNIGLGFNAGSNLTIGDDNIDIGNAGFAGEGNTIRIGDANQTRAFIAGIRGVTPGVAGALPVVIDSAGQLGTSSASAGAGTWLTGGAIGEDSFGGYMGVGINGWPATETDVGAQSPMAGTVDRLQIYETDNCAGEPTFTLRVNGVNTSLTCTASSRRCKDITHTVAVAAGDLISVYTPPSGICVGSAYWRARLK